MGPHIERRRRRRRFQEQNTISPLPNQFHVRIVPSCCVSFVLSIFFGWLLKINKGKKKNNTTSSARSYFYFTFRSPYREDHHHKKRQQPQGSPRFYLFSSHTQANTVRVKKDGAVVVVVVVAASSIPIKCPSARLYGLMRWKKKEFSIIDNEPTVTVGRPVTHIRTSARVSLCLCGTVRQLAVGRLSRDWAIERTVTHRRTSNQAKDLSLLLSSCLCSITHKSFSLFLFFFFLT